MYIPYQTLCTFCSKTMAKYQGILEIYKTTNSPIVEKIVGSTEIVASGVHYISRYKPMLTTLPTSNMIISIEKLMYNYELSPLFGT